MEQEQIKIPFNRLAVARFIRAVRRFASSEESGREAKMMFAGLIALLLGINGMNVINSYVGRDFMTAIADRDRDGFVLQATLYIGVFVASTVISVSARFIEERLGLLWRAFITKRLVGGYLDKGKYYRLDISGELKNPDQRISEDVRAFTVTALAFVVVILNSLFTILAFLGVVWSISPTLFAVSIVYAAFGSFMAIVLGRPLVKLNYDQLDKEASFRSTLVHVRENAEPIFTAHREERLQKRLLSRFDDVVANFRNIIAVNRNLGFFIGGYYWMIGIIPALIVAPDYMDGKIEFGVITQAAMAFSSLVGAFSLIVTQFQSISSFTAVSLRLHSLGEFIEPMKKPSEAEPTVSSGEEAGWMDSFTNMVSQLRSLSEIEDSAEQTPCRAESAIEICEDSGRVAYESLTLTLPQDGQCLLKDLSITIPFGRRVLIPETNEPANVALFKATAGVWDGGGGRIVRPGAEQMFFLAEKPYLPHGTLREVLLRGLPESQVPDGLLAELLRELDVEDIVARAEGFDEEQDWDSLLTLGEQQLLAFLHVLLAVPRFVFLDRIDTALDSGQVRKLLGMLSDRSITYINIGMAGESPDLYDAVLEIQEDGKYRWQTTSGGDVEPAPQSPGSTNAQ